MSLLSFDAYHLIQPLALWLIPLPIAAYILRYIRRYADKTSNDTRQAIYFPHTPALLSITGGVTGTTDIRVFMRHILLWSAWIMCIIALSRPQLPGELLPQHHESRDIMLAVDLSGSMKALDFATRSVPNNRLDVTKNAVRDFVQSRKGDRIGLVVFGSQAFLASPLTPDTQAVSALLDDLQPGMAGDATAIGDALGLAVKHIRDSDERARTIVLLTDGENTAGAITPEQAAALAASYAIRVHTIAVGKEGVIPFPNGYGGVRMVPSSLDETALHAISDSTGGTFFRATDTRALTRIYRDIDRLETVSHVTPPVQLYTPLFRYPLILALCALLLYYLTIPERC